MSKRVCSTMRRRLPPTGRGQAWGISWRSVGSARVPGVGREGGGCSAMKRRHLPPRGCGQAWGISWRSVCATCMVMANRRGGGGIYTQRHPPHAYPLPDGLPPPLQCLMHGEGGPKDPPSGAGGSQAGRGYAISSLTMTQTSGCMLCSRRDREFIGVVHGRQAVHRGLQHLTSDSSYIPHACRCCGHREWPAC